MCLPAAALGYFGYIHFADGVAADAAIPVPVYMVAQIQVPKAAYAAAAKALEGANARNGNAKLLMAEAQIRAAGRSARTADQIAMGLSRAPASSRGWALLSEMTYPAATQTAARALSESLMLSAYDYWLSGSQVADAAQLWPFLDNDTRMEALAKARLLWEEPMLRPRLQGVLNTPGGASLMSDALSEDQRRALNRWLFTTSHQGETP